MQLSRKYKERLAASRPDKQSKVNFNKRFTRHMNRLKKLTKKGFFIWGLEGESAQNQLKTLGLCGKLFECILK